MKAVDVLKRSNLKRTSCREGIIDVFMKTHGVLSEYEIRMRLPGNYDRSTFYRSFKTLLEHKVLQKIVIDNQLVMYGLDSSVTQIPEHAHFYCYKCHKVNCLDDFPLQGFQVPAGYSAQETQVILKGICNACNAKGS